MKLPAILKANDTAAKINAAERAIEKAQTSIEQLAAEREAALAASDDIDAVRKIDAAIADERGAIAALNDRLTILKMRRAEELRIYRERKHWRAVKRFEAALPNRLRAAARLEDAVKAVAVAYREFEASCNAVETVWPPETLMWGVRHIRADRAGALLQQCFSLAGLVRRGSYGFPEPEPSEFASRAATADKRAAGFVADELAHHQELLAELREQGVPEPEHQQEEAA